MRIVALTLLTATSAVASPSPSGAPGRAVHAEAGAGWGIDQIRLRTSAGGHLLDLRYRVIDSRKAAPLLAAGTTPYLLEPRSGRKLEVPNTPKAGPLRSSGAPEQGRSYFALFSNPGSLVKRGDRVSLVIADLRLDDLPVE